MSLLNSEQILRAYSSLRISGLTSNPNNEEMELGFNELIDMMAEFNSRNICTKYIFQDEPDINAESGIATAFNNALQKCLAVRLAPFFGKEVSQLLLRQASQGSSNWAARTSKVNQIQPSRRQARGSGNTFRFSNWTRFYRAGNPAPISCSTFDLKVDAIDFFGVDFSRYLLEGATIDSYTIENTNGIEIINNVQDVDVINLEVKGISAGYQTATITITTSTGRVNPELINFNITES
jgi:hypothetical protein